MRSVHGGEGGGKRKGGVEGERERERERTRKIRCNTAYIYTRRCATPRLASLGFPSFLFLARGPVAPVVFKDISFFKENMCAALDVRRPAYRPRHSRPAFRVFFSATQEASACVGTTREMSAFTGSSCTTEFKTLRSKNEGGREEGEIQSKKRVIVGLRRRHDAHASFRGAGL